jgi:beta-galactosidase
MTLMNWQVFNLPIDKGYLSNLKFEDLTGQSKPGLFFEGNFELKETGDTYLDMSKWGKGVVWVNGHNLGRYWYIGPQQRLFLPGVYLHKGNNKVIIFEMIKTEASPLSAVRELK